MKAIRYKIIAILVCLCVVTVTTRAQWAPPTSAAPAGNVAPPINTGNTGQVKHSAIGVQQSNTPLVIPSGAGFYTDSGIGVRHYNYVSSNPNWTYDGTDYALDTNAPIVANGVYSSGMIVTPKALIGSSIVASNAKTTGAVAGTQRQLCAQGSDGAIVPCAQVTGANLAVTLSAEPSSIAVGTPSTTTLTWQSTSGLTSCYALSGPGFTTGGNTNGTDTSNSFTLASGETQNFAIACSDSNGNTALASASVTASVSAPKITFSTNPSTGGWSNGAFFTTGLSLNPNGGGTMTCRKRVTGAFVSSTNPWSGQASGVWSSPSTLPPGTAAAFNTCSGGCQFNRIVTQPASSAVLTVECSNSETSTVSTQWISAQS